MRMAMMPSCCGRLAKTFLGYFEPRADSGVEIVFAENFLQAQESGFPGAVAGSDLIEFPFIFERIDEAVDVGHGCLDKVQAAENDVRVRVHGAGGLQYLLDAGV